MSAPKICVAIPNTILVRHHLIASSIPTYCRKRKPVISATAKPFISTEKYRPRGHLPILGAILKIDLSDDYACLFDTIFPFAWFSTRLFLLCRLLVLLVMSAS